MSAADWSDVLEGFVYIYAQVIYYTLAIFLALIILASVMQFLISSFSPKERHGD